MGHRDTLSRMRDLSCVSGRYVEVWGIPLTNDYDGGLVVLVDN